MNCKWVYVRLSSYLDGELSAVEMRQVRTHVQSCVACQTELMLLETVKGDIAQLPELSVPAGLEERLASVVFHAESAPVRRQTSLALVASLAFAAAFLCASLWLQTNRTKQMESGRQIARSNFELARDQAYASGADPIGGNSVVLTSTHGIR